MSSGLISDINKKPAFQWSQLSITGLEEGFSKDGIAAYKKACKKAEQLLSRREKVDAERKRIEEIHPADFTGEEIAKAAALREEVMSILVEENRFRLEDVGM
jgi:hypothetical protein